MGMLIILSAGGIFCMEIVYMHGNKNGLDQKRGGSYEEVCQYTVS